MTMRMTRSLSAFAMVVALLPSAGCKPAAEDNEGPKPTPAPASSPAAPVVKATAAAPRPKKIPKRPPQHPSPSPEAVERKARSEARLKSDGVLVNPSLPVVDSEKEAKLRAQDAVVERAIALMIVAVKGEGLEQDAVIRHRDRFQATPFFSPDESAFIADLQPSQRDKAKFGWSYECLAVMLWALSFDAEQGPPNKIVDAGRIVKLVLDRGPEKLRAEAKLRSAKELLDANDLVYRADWACVAARETGGTAPKALDCEIVVERHRALNWLIGYNGQDWDDVSTDT